MLQTNSENVKEKDNGTKKSVKISARFKNVVQMLEASKNISDHGDCEELSGTNNRVKPPNLNSSAQVVTENVSSLSTGEIMDDIPAGNVKIIADSSTKDKENRKIDMEFKSLSIEEFVLEFIEFIEKGLKSYLYASDNETLSFLNLIRINKNMIFGNIVEIYSFEKDILYPRLCECEGDLKMIFDLFSKFLDDGRLDCYIVYAINSNNYKKIFAENRHVIDKKEQDDQDPMGFEKLLGEPLAHILNYHVVLASISKNSEDIYAEVLNDFKKFTLLVKNSLKLHDIQNCHDIDFLAQGKLLRVDTFAIKINEGRSFTGTVFLFAKRIIITESMTNNNKDLNYRLDLCDASVKSIDDKRIIVSDRNQVVMLSSDDTTTKSWKLDFDTTANVEELPPKSISLRKMKDVILHDESVYIMILRVHYKLYFQVSHEKLTEIQLFLHKILEFHSNVLFPELEKNRTKFKLLVKSFHNLFGPDIVNYYYKYSAFVSSAEKVLSQTIHEKSANALGVEEFLNYPIGQIESYKNVFTTAIENYQGPGTENEDDGEYLAALAAMEVKMRELFKKIQEIKRVYAVDDANIFYANTGLICYYDSGMCNKHPSKIFLMEKQVIAMEVFGDAYTVIFQSFYKDIDAKNPLLGDKCSLKFELQNRKKNIFTFIFNAEKKQIFYTKFLDQKAKSK